MELYNYKEEASFNPKCLELHGEYSILDLDDNINDMVLEMPPAPAFDFKSDGGDSSSSDHQLCSLPPTIGPAGDYLSTSQESEAFLTCSSARGRNFSSSGESEAASQGSSSSTQAADSTSKRKSEDYRQHSSSTSLFHPPTTTTWSTSAGGGGFQLLFDAPESWNKKSRTEPSSSLASSSSSNIDFRQEKYGYEPDMEAIAQMKETIYRAAALRPVVESEGPSAMKPRRKNVRISSDPQTAAARRRRERIGDRLRALQKLVPGGSKMDTASMLDEAASYLKFLKSQVTALETLAAPSPFPTLLQHFNHHQNPNAHHLI